MFPSVLAISLGAVCGALLRWFLSTRLNTLFPEIPPGTLLVNLAGGYCIGAVASLFAQFPTIPPEIRLLVVTGFLGALTTMSTFSAEVVNLLRDGRVLMALAAVALHVGGSFIMTGLGIATVNWLGRLR